METLKRLYSVYLFLGIATVVFAQTVLAQATLTSDQSDYPPGTTAILVGNGFQAGESVTLQVLHDGGIFDNDTGVAHDPWQVLADSAGSLQTDWYVPPDQDEIGATLRATADGQSSGLHAEVVFTDATAWTLTISPPTTVVAETHTFTLTVTNTSTGAGNQIGCITDTIPTAFSPVGSPGLVSASGHSWTISRTGNIIRLTANSSADRINNGETLQFTIEATAPSATTGAPFKWSGAARANTNCTGNSFGIPGGSGQPVVDVTCVPPSIATDPADQAVCAGTDATFHAAAGGSPVPALQWQVSTDGGATFADISGAIANPLTFTATASLNANKYRAVFTNLCGVATSNAATLTVNRAPAITCPANIVVNNDPGQCGAQVSFSATASGSPDPTLSYSHNPGSVFPIGTTIVRVKATNACGLDSCSFTVTVQDREGPTIACPANIVQATDPGQCSAVVSFTVTAGDNCPGVSVVSTPASGSLFPKGTTRVQSVATDAAGNTDSCSFTVTVQDREGPTIACPANISVLVDSASCSAIVNFSASASDNCPGVTVECTPPSGTAFPKGVTTVTCVATDASGNRDSCRFTVTVSNPAPEAVITAPAPGTIFPAGTPVTFTATFSDNKGSHTAAWTFDVLTQPGIVNEANGTVSATQSFASAGVYFVKLVVKDQCGDSGVATQMGGFSEMVVVYDPNGGFVTGGGWITSPKGAYRSDTTLTGKANFGFVSKYQKGSSIPTGETEFQFQLAKFNFHSTSYDWLTVSGARAQYKGSGMINGTGSYGFLLSAVDGDVKGGGGLDKFRIKIYDKATSAIVYDNQFGSSDTSCPTTVLGGGSIVIHQNGPGSSTISMRSNEESGRGSLPTEYALYQNYPNPFNPSTEIRFDLPEDSRVAIVVYDILGREVKTLAEGEWASGSHAATWNGANNQGQQLASGIYLVRLSTQSLTGNRRLVAVKKMMMVR